MLGRLAAVCVAVAVLPLTAFPAAAATRASHVTAAAAPATVHIGSPVVVSGRATPVRAGALINVQRLVGHVWKTVAHQRSGVTGTFSLTVAAPRTVGPWSLRVVRAAGGGNRAGTSATLHVRVVKPVFVVSATATTTAVRGTVVVTGKVAPRSAGPIRLQRQVGKAWVTVATSRLSKAGRFGTTVRLSDAGGYALRVLRPYTTTVAQGVSKTLRVTVPVADPVVTSTSLVKAVVGRPYAATLSGSSGVGPYTWSVAGLPAGLQAGASGQITGTTVLPGVFPITATVADSRGRTGTAVLSLTVAQTHVQAWGWDDSGQVGDGGPGVRLTAVPMQGIDAVTAVAGISGVALLLRADGTVWGVGDDAYGQLGLGPVTSAPYPTLVPGVTNAVAVATGQGFGLVLTSDGTVWTSGSNTAGQLGDGTTVARRTFSPVLSLGRAVSIAAGINDGYAVLADGTVWGWGVNAHGELGQGSSTGDQVTPVPVPGLTGARSVAGSGQGAYVLMADGTVRAWGRNTNGQLGNGTVIDSASPVTVSGLSGVASLATSLSAATGYAVKTDGTVWAWGYNHNGSVGDGTTVTRTTPVQVPGVTGAVAVSPGLAAAYVVMSDGRLLEWGEGSSGALATGDTRDALSPIATPGIAGAVAAGGGEATGYAVVAD